MCICVRVCMYHTFLLFLLSNISYDVIYGVWDHITLFSLHTKRKTTKDKVSNMVHVTMQTSWDTQGMFRVLLHWWAYHLKNFNAMQVWAAVLPVGTTIAWEKAFMMLLYHDRNNVGNCFIIYLPPACLEQQYTVYFSTYTILVYHHGHGFVRSASTYWFEPRLRS